MFKPGGTYIRKEIHKRFGEQSQSGISTPADYPIIFIFTGDSGSKHGYKDDWINRDVFLYTGEGQNGDMVFKRGNKAIRDHAKNSKDIYLFKAIGNGAVKFVSKMFLRKWRYEGGYDTDNCQRKIIRFELEKVK